MHGAPRVQFDPAMGGLEDAVASGRASPKIGDFGMALRMRDDESHASGVGQGTPFYAAPEVVSGLQLHRESDVYSFGIMMWELITGTTVYIARCAPAPLLPSASASPSGTQRRDVSPRRSWCLHLTIRRCIMHGGNAFTPPPFPRTDPWTLIPR